ncbi:MAG: hypothetical protein NDJ89_12360 [Oligoflexia bacterium]|nr:hypothetical protein [Oligoflexia bacterium]
MRGSRFIAAILVIQLGWTGLLLAEASASEERLGLALDLGVSSSFHELKSADHSSDATLTLAPSYRLSEDLTLGAKLGAKKELENELKADLSDTKLSLAHAAITLNPYLSIAPALGGTLATSRESIRKNSLRGAVSAGETLVLDLSRAGLPALSISNTTRLTRSFHEFKTARTGASNTALSLLNMVSADYALTDRLTLGASFSRGIGRTYDGALKHNFEFYEAVTYRATPALALSVALSNEGNAYKENGRDSAVSLFSRDDASFLTSMKLVF